MSEVHSPSTGRRYSIKRVCAVWQIPRSTVHSQLRRSSLTDLPAPRKRGPVGAATDEELVSLIRQVKVRDKGLAPLVDSPDDLYQTNIQISELNALNACLAVIRFKQLRGFYFEEIPYYHLLLELGDLQIVGESELSED